MHFCHNGTTIWLQCQQVLATSSRGDDAWITLRELKMSETRRLSRAAKPILESLYAIGGPAVSGLVGQIWNRNEDKFENESNWVSLMLIKLNLLEVIDNQPTAIQHANVKGATLQIIEEVLESLYMATILCTVYEDIDVRRLISLEVVCNLARNAAYADEVGMALARWQILEAILFHLQKSPQALKTIREIIKTVEETGDLQAASFISLDMLSERCHFQRALLSAVTTSATEAFE